MASIVKREVFPSGGIPTPMSEERVRLLLRMPANLKAKLVELAQRERRSLNRQIEFLLERSIREESKGEAGESVRPKGESTKRK